MSYFFHDTPQREIETPCTGEPCTNPEHDHEGLLLICPNCGEPSTFTPHQHDWVETHGLDCGPYEHCHQEWVKCDKCGANTDEAEIMAAQPAEQL